MKPVHGGMDSLWSRGAPYLAPMLFFMAFLMVVDGYFPDQHYLFYPIKTGLVAVLLAYYWKKLPPLKPTAILMSIVVGVIGVFLWVSLDYWAMALNAALASGYNTVVSSIGLTSWETKVEGAIPAGRNPFDLYPPAGAWALFALRVLGISLVVPIMEELFWRGFLMRWLIKEDFQAVPIGTYQTFSFWVTTLLFASIHGAQWPLGIIVGLFYGAWFVRTKSLGNVMVAHGVTNFLLALYCLFFNDWHFLCAVNPAPEHK